MLRTLLKEAGLDPNTDVTWLAIGSPATALAAFTSGQVDVAMSYTQLEVNLRAAGAGLTRSWPSPVRARRSASSGRPLP